MYTFTHTHAFSLSHTRNMPKEAGRQTHMMRKHTHIYVCSLILSLTSSPASQNWKDLEKARTGTGWITQWIMDCKIVRTVDFLIVNLWIVLDGVSIATARLSDAGWISPSDWRDVYMFVFILILQALFFLHLLLLLSVFGRLCARAKPILIPSPLFCVTKPFVSTSGSDEKNGAFM